jgi:hypothetical protein
MRIGPIEISWSPRRPHDDTVLRLGSSLPVRLGDLTPEGVREALDHMLGHMRNGGKLVMDTKMFQTVVFLRKEGDK